MTRMGFETGQLVVQRREHRSQVGKNWGIGTVVGFDATYIRTYWPMWNQVWSMRVSDIEVVRV